MSYRYQIRLHLSNRPEELTLLGSRPRLSTKKVERQPTGWVDCSKEEYMNAERMAGFIAQHPGEPATHAFYSPTLEGRVVYVREESDGTG